MQPYDPDVHPELDPDYDILQDEELMRMLGLDKPQQPKTEAHVPAPQPETAPAEPEPEKPASAQKTAKKPASKPAKAAPAPQPKAEKPKPEKPKAEKPKPAPQPEKPQTVAQSKAQKTKPADQAPKDPAGAAPKFDGLWWGSLLTCIYFELLLLIADPGDTMGNLSTVLLFSVAGSQLIYGLLRLFIKPRLQRIAAGVMMAVGAFLYGLEYFINGFFSNYMDLRTVLSSAGQVAGSYSSEIWGTLLGGWWMVLLLLVPLVVWIAFRKKIPISPCRFFAKGEEGTEARKLGLAKIGIMLAAHLMATILILLTPVMRSGYSEIRTSMTFDKQVSSFGLMAAGRLDLENSLFAKKASFVITPTTTPTETAATSASSAAPGETTDPQTPTEQEAPVSYHTMGIDFDRLARESDDETIASIHEYVASLPMGKTNEYTGLFKGKNLILITAESFSAECIDPDLTPTLYRMAHKGIEFDEFYQPAWGGSTTTGEFSVIMGLVPADGGNSTRDTIGNNNYMTLGSQLQRLGYFSRAYHNNTYDYYDRDQTHENFGYDKYIGIGNGLEEGVTQCWPESDLEMIDFTLPDLIQNQPFSAYYMTVSGHGEWRNGSNAMGVKNFDATEGLPYSDTVRYYLASNLELEYAMESLISQLEEAGIADDTVVVICSDHYPYILNPSDTLFDDDTDYLAELYGYVDDTLPQQDHNALIIWSGCLEKMDHIEVETPVYSLDIVPTVSNLFGFDYDSRLLVGRDALSDEEAIVIWPNYSWKTEKGYYSASRGTFTPDPGVENVDEAYMDRIDTIVRNRISFSGAVLFNDYYDHLYD